MEGEAASTRAGRAVAGSVGRAVAGSVGRAVAGSVVGAVARDAGVGGRAGTAGGNRADTLERLAHCHTLNRRRPETFLCKKETIISIILQMT